MQISLPIDYEFTNDIYKAKKWLENMPDIIACDFEVASKFTAKEKELIQFKLNNYRLGDEERRVLQQQLVSNGLSHPSLTVITHFSIAESYSKSYVIICDIHRIRQLICNYLINTNKLQLWHNAQFDWKHIHYYTNSFPKNYLDTMLLARSLLNNANSMYSKVGLKELMSYTFGEWAISKDSFTLEEMWNPKTIKYAAIDTLATFKLYEDIQEEITKWRI